MGLQTDSHARISGSANDDLNGTYELQAHQRSSKPVYIRNSTGGYFILYYSNTNERWLIVWKTEGDPLGNMVSPPVM